MDFHLEHGLRLHTEPKHKNLYKWAINEIDAQGRQIGGDQIPWDWTLCFTATSCVLCDSVDIYKQPQFFKTASEPPPELPPKIAQRQVIQVQLRPGSPSDDLNYSRETTFSMFCTDRAIKSFQLDIHPIAGSVEQEHCTASGTVSYTAENDFRNFTVDDCIVFHFFVKPETFARYAANIAHGSADELILSVGKVAGFYSEWSPSISTRNVKVLTKGSEQQITLPPGHQFEPPRLGHVHDANLQINRRLGFGKRAPELEAFEEMADCGTVRAVPKPQTPVAVDPRMLGSLRRAAWFVVCLLVLIFIVTLLKR